MKFIFDDGGRADAGYKGFAGDCVCRAISIATELPYKQVYDLINQYSKLEEKTLRTRSSSSARNGVYKATIRKVMKSLGWKWTPTMLVGQGCKVHLREDELPNGRIIVSLSKHVAAVIDGVLHDTFNCTRDGTRCVYGYYSKG